MTQGPAITKSGCSWPRPSPSMVPSCVLPRSPPPPPPPMQRRADERGEQRMGRARPRSKLGMKLHAHEPGMVGQLDDLHQVALGVDPAERHARAHVPFAIGVVKLIAVAVPFRHVLPSIRFVGTTALVDAARIRAETH